MKPLFHYYIPCFFIYFVPLGSRSKGEADTIDRRVHTNLLASYDCSQVR